MVHEEGHEERIKESRELRKKTPLVKSCTVCDPEVKLPNNVKNHYLRHHRVSSLFLHPCPHCWEWFSTTDDLNNHMTFHTGQLNTLNCNLCTFTVSAKLAIRAPRSGWLSNRVGQKSMDAHLNIHQNGISCEHCAKQFNDTHRLKMHLQTHEEKSVVCSECGAMFRKQFKLKEHIELKHTQRVNYCCDVCEKRFPTARHLSAHKVRHNSLNPFTCEMCGKCFKTRGDMNWHYRRLHTDRPKKYRKQVKGSSSPPKNTLTNDLNSQSEPEKEVEEEVVKDHECDLCDKKFGSENGLKIHMGKTQHSNAQQLSTEVM